MDSKTIEVRLRLGLPVPKVRSLSPSRRRPRYDRQYRDDLRADRMFRDGQTARPHKRRGTKNDPTDFKRAYVTLTTGSMPEKKRDTRHPDLKRPKPIKAVTEPGAPRRRDAVPSFKRSGGINTKAPAWQRQAILHNNTERT